MDKVTQLPLAAAASIAVYYSKFTLELERARDRSGYDAEGYARWKKALDEFEAECLSHGVSAEEFFAAL